MNICRSLLAVVVASFVVPHWAYPAEHTFVSNGVKIRYVTEGAGEPIVLIHGWMADSSMWGQDKKGNTKLDTTRADGFLIIALDCRGHGKSDKPYEADKYGVEMAEDIVRLLDHLKLDKAHLIGYSSGSFIAGKVAAMHPDRVRSIVYAGQAPIIARVKKPVDAVATDKGAKPKAVAETNEVEIFAKAVEDGKGLGRYIIAVTPADRKKPSPLEAELFARYMFHGKDVKAFAVAGRSFGKLAVTGDDLKKCTAPVLFLHGANESEYVKQSVANVQKLLGRGEIIKIKDGDHMTTLTKPEFGDSITKFLRANMGK